MIGKTNAWALPSTVPESPTAHKVIFIDPFGVVNEQWVEDGTNAIIPTPRVHEYLTFVEWNQSTENVTEDRVVGATYNTTNGKTYAKIRLTTISRLSPTLYLNKSDTSTLTVDWGDGTTSTYTNSGNFNTGAHNYSVAGDYIITMWISVGTGTYSFGNGTDVTTFVGGSSQNYRNTLLKLYIGDSVTSIWIYAFYSCSTLINVSIPNSVTGFNSNAFYNCYSLKNVSIPNSVTTIGGYAFFNCTTLKNVSISNSVTSIGVQAFNNCYSLTNVSSFNSVTSIVDRVFYNCYSLKNVSIPNSVTSIRIQPFTNCRSLTNVSIPNSVTSIGDEAFTNCYSILEYKIYATTPPTLVNINAFTNINSICKIYVPDASLTAYKTATNWATYENYIYPLSDIGE